MKTRKMPAVWLYGGMIGMILYAVCQIISGKRSWAEILAALLPGVVCYLCARLTKTIGEGDAWLILGMGLCFSLKEVLFILMTALFLSALGVSVVMIVKRDITNRKIAFVPFLFCALLMVWTGGLL